MQLRLHAPTHSWLVRSSPHVVQPRPLTCVSPAWLSRAGDTDSPSRTRPVSSATRGSEGAFKPIDVIVKTVGRAVQGGQEFTVFKVRQCTCVCLRRWQCKGGWTGCGRMVPGQHTVSGVSAATAMIGTQLLSLGLNLGWLLWLRVRSLRLGAHRWRRRSGRKPR
jgi:hypothetical protein